MRPEVTCHSNQRSPSCSRVTSSSSTTTKSDRSKAAATARFLLAHRPRLAAEALTCTAAKPCPCCASHASCSARATVSVQPGGSSRKEGRHLLNLEAWAICDAAKKLTCTTQPTPAGATPHSVQQTQHCGTTARCFQQHPTQATHPPWRLKCCSCCSSCGGPSMAITTVYCSLPHARCNASTTCKSAAGRALRGAG